MSAPAESVAVLAKPIRTGLIANISAVFAVLVFLAVAILMRSDSAGASFGPKDQIFTLVIGLVVAGGLRLPARPRLRADTTGVYLRGYVGNWRVIPWSAIIAVEFPSTVRFARLVLPADETLAIYAVQRMDREYAVGKMRSLRALFAETHPVG